MHCLSGAGEPVAGLEIGVHLPSKANTNYLYTMGRLPGYFAHH